LYKPLSVDQQRSHWQDLLCNDDQAYALANDPSIANAWRLLLRTKPMVKIEH